MRRQTITADISPVKSLAWVKGRLVDFAQGLSYSLENGKGSHFGYRRGYHFDAAVVSGDGVYAVIYHKLGTKGLLLKNGDLLREINRSYYQADRYEYPVAFFKAANAKVYLIHCPVEYGQLEFEDVETGEIVSRVGGRAPQDFFHSRLEVCPNNRFLLSKGWKWHPLDMVSVFDLEACLLNPLLLDQLTHPSVDFEVCSASFIDDTLVLLGIGADAENIDGDCLRADEANQLMLWNISDNQITQKIKIDGELGNIVVVNKEYVLDLYKHPKLINFKTGELVEQFFDINSGLQKSSVIGYLNADLPKIAWNRQSVQLAISTANSIEILSF